MDLISVHVPKTAGRSFLLALRSIYNDKVLEDYYGQPHAVCDNHHSVTPEKIKTISQDVRVIHGHFNLIKYKDYFCEAKRIVWLRNPVDRLISHFYYLKSNLIPGDSFHREVLEKNMSLIEFAEAPIMRNQIRAAYLPPEHDNSLFFVGLTERLSSDFKKLADMMGWPQLDMPLENKTEFKEYREFRLDQKTKYRLEKLNEQDMDLYFKYF